ncbi:MAG: hypothetical protein AAFV53_40230 [Myxococcota bacterium]
MEETFTLHDRNGDPHDYEVTLHPPMEGLIISQQLASLGLEPITQAIEGVLPHLARGFMAAQEAANKAGRDTISMMDFAVDPEALVWDLRVGRVGEQLSAAIRRLDVGLVQKILAKTTRDGRPMGSSRRINSDFDDAYRGNYTELFVACGRVIAINGFLPLDGISAIGARIQEAADELLSPSKTPPDAASAGGFNGSPHPTSTPTA